MKSRILKQLQLQNFIHSLLLLVGMLGLLSLVGFLLSGLTGLFMLFGCGLIVLLSIPRLPTQLIMQIYGAQKVNQYQIPVAYNILQQLSKHANLSTVPGLYYLPSRLMLAFSLGIKGDEAVVLSDAMLRKLTIREVTAVLAHEISHIYNKDIWVMMLADIISRFTSILALTAYILIIVYLPIYFISDHKVPWLLLIILMLAPTISAIMQLALSRTREFNADFNAVLLTGDPQGLISALRKIEYFQGRWYERIFMPNRRLPDPSLLRTHPQTEDRIKRLLALKDIDYTATNTDEIELDLTDFKPYHRDPERRFKGFWY
ncbi:MAG: zinc metalloprotease HtpX [Gammaproteobacteria bacterium]|nr:zinc metalloprotease HtpX [Gammaproteobacteria bacterium]MCW8910839.1 zinc metalloprotease HtpX [Gammaproteobacteria bacterium]MCW9005046.1 zinc metalloprotease HtpX [Gammaproteobacteria bacterium]MCW9056554.1 zinc metalloprotease HtpX [Gammaproteobacteria bacterium]